MIIPCSNNYTTLNDDTWILSLDCTKSVVYTDTFSYNWSEWAKVKTELIEL